MKNPTPQEIALISSGLIGLCCIVFTFLFINTQITWWLALLMGLVIIPISFGIFSYYLRHYIYRKIKVIYKTIHSEKMTKEQKRELKRFNMNSRIIEQVEEEVVEWAANRKAEIESLKEMEHYRRNLLGNISHELKTPIFNVQGFVHTLLDGAINDKKVNLKYLKRAATNIERLQNIVEDLDVIGQIEVGELTMDFQKFDIHGLAKEVFQDLEIAAQERSIKLKIKEGCDHPFFVFADRDRVAQVLINLINNAIKYGRDGGYVQCSFYDMDKNILIEVSDNGIGMEKKYLPRLFERFYRIDKSRSRSQGGTGLGLSIVKHIIEAHQQTINVRSTVGVGSTFGFTLQKYTKA